MGRYFTPSLRSPDTRTEHPKVLPFPTQFDLGKRLVIVMFCELYFITEHFTTTDGGLPS